MMFLAILKMVLVFSHENVLNFVERCDISYVMILYYIHIAEIVRYTQF